MPYRSEQRVIAEAQQRLRTGFDMRCEEDTLTWLYKEGMS